MCVNRKTKQNKIIWKKNKKEGETEKWAQGKATRPG